MVVRGRNGCEKVDWGDEELANVVELGRLQEAGSLNSSWLAGVLLMHECILVLERDLSNNVKVRGMNESGHQPFMQRISHHRYDGGAFGRVRLAICRIYRKVDTW
jgi:hypothetical protein